MESTVALESSCTMIGQVDIENRLFKIDPLSR
jgi:hypothetical protein